MLKIVISMVMESISVVGCVSRFSKMVNLLKNFLFLVRNVIVILGFKLIEVIYWFVFLRL